MGGRDCYCNVRPVFENIKLVKIRISNRPDFGAFSYMGNFVVIKLFPVPFF